MCASGSVRVKVGSEGVKRCVHIHICCFAVPIMLRTYLLAIVHRVAKAERVYPGMRLQRCHTFDIEAKFLYKCTRCDYSIKRHSKSIDVNSAVCPFCKR